MIEIKLTINNTYLYIYILALFQHSGSRSNSVSSNEDKLAESDPPKDYIELYESDSEKLPPPPPPEHLYDFERESNASTNSGVEEKPRSLASMGDLVVGEIEKLSLQEVSVVIYWLGPVV